MATDSRKRLALAVVDFLNTSLKDGTLTPENADNIEIAANCISEAFGVDATDSTAVHDALGGQSLLSIYNVYEKMRGKTGAKPAAAATTSAAAGSDSASTGSGASAAPAGAAGTDASSAPKPGQQGGPTEESERLKGQGNAAMQKKDFQGAISLYTQALEIAPLNPIYLSNRAAAYSAATNHELAKNDAELAVAADPKYTKAWSRLGLALYALGDAKGSMEAYQKGIDAEGNGGSDAMKKGFETARRKVEEQGAMDTDADPLSTRSGAGAGGAGGMPDLAGLANMLGGGGGMPDLSSLMQNPMMRSMAQNLMSNPEMLNGLLNNPAMQGLAERFGSAGGAGGAGGARGEGGGTPNLSELMNDPAIADMARNFMGSMGGASRGT